MIDLPINELLCGLAEECGELTQAALKLRRAYDQTNPTPVDPDRAYEDLYEEVADVLLYIDQLNINMNYVRHIMNTKMKRWQSRMNDKEDERA